MRTTRLHVTLREVTPAVVRVVDAPAASTLAEVHELLQSAIGWTDSHLHAFTGDPSGLGGVHYGSPDADLGTLDDTAAHLSDLPDRFVYLYDYGDGWTHDVRRTGPGADRPGLPYGEGDCPPEDCGGPPGHAELLAALADPTHPDHDHMRAWAGDRRAFDPAATDVLVRQTAGVVPGSVRLLLDLAREGIRLTPGGRLPRAVVREIQQQRPDWSWSDKPAHTEEDLPALCALHDVLRDTGLLRLRNGALLPLRAAGDDLTVVRRLRGWFTRDAFTAVLAELVLALLCAHGPAGVDDLAARVHPLLGPGWVTNGRPLTTDDVKRDIHRLTPTLLGLDLLCRDERLLVAGAAARSLLPGATRRAHLRDPNKVDPSDDGERGPRA